MVFLQVQIKIMATGCDEEQGEQNQLLSLHHSPPRDWWRLSISYWTNTGFELQHFQYWFKAAEKGVKEEGLLSYWLKKTWNMNYFIVAMEIGWVKQFEIKSMKVLLSLPTCCMGWVFFFHPISMKHEVRQRSEPAPSQPALYSHTELLVSTNTSTQELESRNILVFLKCHNPRNKNTTWDTNCAADENVTHTTQVIKSSLEKEVSKASALSLQQTHSDRCLSPQWETSIRGRVKQRRVWLTVDEERI